MLPGVVPFPPEFAQRYRARGYWQDKSLAEEFSFVFDQFKDRVALVDGERRYTYRQIDELTDNLALNLLELGLKPLDRVVPTLPKIDQFVQLSGATACFYPERQGEFAFEPMIRRVQAANPHLEHCVSLPRLEDLIH